jgi:CBS domain-containing protein
MSATCRSWTDDEKVIGIVSIGDVVKEMISQQQFIIGQLENYITG